MANLTERPEGRAVAVAGRLAYSEWQAKDGSKRSKHQVVGRVSFGGRPESDRASQANDVESSS